MAASNLSDLPPQPPRIPFPVFRNRRVPARRWPGGKGTPPPSRCRSFVLVVLAGLLLPCWAWGSGGDDLQACVRQFEGRGYEEAQACLAAYVARRPADTAALAYLGRACLKRRQAEPAVDWLSKAVAREPGRSDLHDWLGQAYGLAAQRAGTLRQFGLASKVRKEFERAVELDPANPDALADLIEFQIEAPGLLGGSLEKAKAHAAELERRNPLRGRLARAAILLHQAAGFAAAERELQATAASFPHDSRPQLALAGAYEQARRYERALDALEAVLRLDPDNDDAHQAFARIAASSGQRLPRAEELLTSYLGRVPPGDSAALADGHYALASVFERKGDAARARSHYLEALRRDPGLAEARDALRRLR
jgi:tetratricopeptide (TPR) repeat protein